MKTYIQPGDAITFIAPSALLAGAGVVIGSLFGVVANDVASGAQGTMAVTGIYDLPKATGQAWTAGQLLYWSGTNVTNVVATNKLIGAATQAQAAGDTIGRVRLNGAAITP